MTTVVDGLRVEVGLGSTPATPLASIAWTDVTGDVLLPRTVTFNRGRGSQESGATPGRLTLTLNNDWAAVDRTNLVPNPSFETDTTGWAAGDGAPTVARSTAVSHSGTYSLKVTPSATTWTGVLHATRFAVTAGQTYSISAQMYAQASRTGAVTLLWYDDADTFLGNDVGYPALTASSWNHVERIQVAPVGATYVRPYFAVIDAVSGEDWWLDSVLVEQSSTVGSYFDGSTPGYYWTGTAHASTSRTATSLRRGRWTRGGSNCTVGWGLRVPIRVLYTAPINGSFEADASGWGALSACTVARSTAQAYSGSASLALTATSAANMSAILYGIEVRPSQTYLARARIRASAASRTGYVKVAWFTAGAAYISSSTGTPAALTSGAWVEVTTAVTAPASAAYAALAVYVATPAVSEVAYVDLVALDLGLWLGYVDAARPAWENGVRPVVEVSATDRLGRFQQRKLTSLAAGEVLYDDPAAFFPLSESATSATVGDTSGNARGTLSLITCGSPTTATFEMGSAEVPGGDGITSAGFAPDNDRNGYALAGDLAGMPSAYYGISCLVRMVAAPSGSDITLVQLAAGTNLAPLRLKLLDGGYPAVYSGTGLSFVQATSTLPLNEWVALFGWQDASGSYLRVASVGYAVAVAPAQFAPTRLYVGGTNKPADGSPLAGTYYHHAFTGNIANVALWSSVPGSTRRTEHGKAGDGFAGDTAVERFQRICRVAGLASADYATTSTSLTVPPGNSAPAMGEQPTDGRPFLDAVQECADVERGVAYMDGAGVLTLQRGAFRFNQAVALTLAPKDVDPGTSIDDDLDRLTNDVTVRRVGGAEQRVVNQASVDAYDTHNDTIDIYTSDDGQALAVAAWRVADEGTPQPRVDSVAVDAVAKAATVAASSLLTVPQSGRVQLTPMPTPASHSSTVDLLADGFTDRVTESSWLRTMTTSSATNYSNVWLWDTATEKFDTGGVLY